MKMLDKYTLQARMLPGMAMLTPWIFFANFVIAKLDINITLPIIFTNVFLLAFSIIIASIVRDIGKKKEKRLLAEWDGAPTTRFLRYRNVEYNQYNKERVKRYCKVRFSGIGWPTEEYEANNPKDADAKYEAYVNELKALTRINDKFPLLHAENRNYGMWRNLWAIKIYGIIANAIVIIVAIIFRIMLAEIVGNIMLFVFCLLSVLLILFWIFLVTKKKIKVVSECYAERLLETCVSLAIKEDKE